MATWYAQSAGDWVSSANWNSAADGSGSSGSPANGDTADVNALAVSISGGSGLADVTVVDGAGGGSLSFAPSSIIYSSMTFASSLSSLTISNTEFGGGSVNTVNCGCNFSGAMILDSGSALIVNVTPTGALNNYFTINGTLVLNNSVTLADVTSVAPTGNTCTYLSTVTPGVTPNASDVRSGVPVGATTGTCAVPTAGEVLDGVAVDATTGNVVLPATSQVQAGVTFGPSNSDSGTYSGGGGGSVVGSSIIQGVRQSA